MSSFFKTLTTEKGQLYFLTNENDYALVFNDYFFRSSRYLFRLLRNYVQVKISRNIYNKFSLARYLNVPGFINSHLEQKKKKKKKMDDECSTLFDQVKFLPYYKTVKSGHR